MGQPAEHDPVLLIVGAFSRFPEALDWAKRELERHFGPVALESPRFAFTETDYYAPTMGEGLEKQFYGFQRLIRPEEIVGIKLQTNALEEAYSRQGGHDVPRPLNLDPGYLSMAKWVLASTKDHAHRIYLGSGIYVELTLRYTAGEFAPWPWTYPDYRRDDYRAFLLHARRRYQGLLRGER